ncbi:MAG: hypothetical protein ACLRUM_08310 [Veillonella parvula]
MLKTSVLKGRLEPGKMLLIDTEEQRIISDEEIKHRVATELPYNEWVKEHVIHLSEITQADESTIPTIVDDLFKESTSFWLYPRRPCSHDCAYGKRW